MKYLSSFIAFCLLTGCCDKRASPRGVTSPSLSGNPKSITTEDIRNIESAIGELKITPVFIQHIYIHDSSFVEVTTSDQKDSITGDYFYLIKKDDGWIEKPTKKRKTWIE